MPENAPLRSISRRHRHPRDGFTLVEILIVVTILGILAAIVVPQFTSASVQARESALETTLVRVRQQLQVYAGQHNGDFPSLADFEAQLTGASDIEGNTAALGTAGYRFGPYLTEMPQNPHTDGTDLGTGEAGSSSWYYNATDGDFRANDSDATRAY